MQTFVDRSIFSDDIDCSNSARLLLARMLMYVHQQLVVHGGLDEKCKSIVNFRLCLDPMILCY